MLTDWSRVRQVVCARRRLLPEVRYSGQQKEASYGSYRPHRSGSDEWDLFNLEHSCPQCNLQKEVRKKEIRRPQSLSGIPTSSGSSRSSLLSRSALLHGKGPPPSRRLAHAAATAGNMTATLPQGVGQARDAACPGVKKRVRHDAACQVPHAVRPAPDVPAPAPKRPVPGNGPLFYDNAVSGNLRTLFCVSVKILRIGPCGLRSYA